MTRGPLAAVAILIALSALPASAQDDTAARVAAAQKRLAERQAAAAKAATRPAAVPATKPTGTAPQQTASRVVFLVDGTGSMTPRMKAVAEEISRAIDGMSESTSFNIVVAVAGKPAVFSPAWQLPNETTRQDAVDFVRAASAGGTDEVFSPAVEAVAKMRPGLVWFLSDGEMNDARTVAAALAKLKGVRINTTTAFANPLNTGDTPEREFLMSVAKSTGGKCVDRDGKLVTSTASPNSSPLQKSGESPATSPARPPKGKSIFKE